MLPVILFILKLLGILVLIVLGLVLGVVLLVLFVPVRYRVEGSYFDRPEGRARITWLLHMVSVTAAYEDDFSVVIRLFGFRILKPAEESREEAEDMLVQAMEVTGEDSERISGELIRDVEESGKERLRNEDTAQADGEPEKAPEPEAEEMTEAAEEEGPAGEKQPADDKSPGDEKTPAGEKQPAGGKRREFPGGKAEKAADRLAALIEKIKFFFRNLCDKLKQGNDKKEEIQAWITDKDNQKTARLLIRQAKKLICHLLPLKGKGEVVFGFDDPYTTGQVLTAVTVLYPFCHDKLNFCPVFDRQIFTAEGHFRGRIRIGTLLLIAGRMVLDKNFRILLRKWLR